MAFRGIGILAMIYGLEGDPNAEFCIADPKPMPRRIDFSHTLSPDCGRDRRRIPARGLPSVS